MPMIGDAELASLKAEGLRAMPDTVTILRNTPTQTPTGGWRPAWAPHHTPKCRLSASVLTVPAGTDITPADRVRVPDGSGFRDFEVAAGKTVASWNMSDSWTLTEVQRG
jgi:hypothetical protein